MSQQININTVNGSFLVPCYEKDSDVFKTGMAYNTTSLTIQVGTVDGGFYSYSGAAITDATAPTGSNEIGFYQLDPAATMVKLQLHSSVYDTLSVGSGETGGILAISASGFGSMATPISFGPTDVNIVTINGLNVSGVNTVNATGGTSIETYHSSVNEFSMFYSDGLTDFDYYGRNLSGTWQIQKVNRTNSATTTANIANNFLYKTLAKAWENKLTLSYS